MKLERFVVYPGDVRGGGNITSNLLAVEILKSGCDLDDNTSVIDGVSREIYTLFGSSDNYSVASVMHLIGGNLIKNLHVEGYGVYFDLVSTSSISSMAELNGIVYNLQYANGEISFSVWNSSNQNLHDADLVTLESAVTSLSYSGTGLNYTVVGEISD